MSYFCKTVEYCFEALPLNPQDWAAAHSNNISPKKNICHFQKYYYFCCIKNRYKKIMSNRVKKASNFFFWLLRCVFRPVLWFKYRFWFEYNTSKGIKRPCLILANHQTIFDQFAVGLGFRFGINYVASDSIFRHGFQSWLMKVLVSPIPFSKGSSDAIAIKDIMHVIKSGGAVGMFPSGNRTFFGDECTIQPGIGKLAKKLGVPVVLVKIRGGFNTKPRWNSIPSKGKMRAGVSRIISPEELKSLSYDELNNLIIKELYFDEFEWNRKEQIVFRGEHKAEHLEIVLFYCPQCGQINKLSSKGNDFLCECGMHVRVNDTGFFDRIGNAEKCPDTILEWSKLQLEYVKSIDFGQFIDKPLFSDENIRFSLVKRAKNQELLGTGKITMYGDKITVCDKDFPVDKIKDIAIQDMRRLTIYTEEGAFVADFPMHGNLMKYMICGYHLKNILLNIERGYGY